MIDWNLVRTGMELIELSCSAQSGCPNQPCYSCLRRDLCESFISYRKENPEYDFKYTSYESQRRLIEKALCEASNREQVLQQETHPSQMGQNILGYRRPNMKLDFSEVSELEGKLIPEGTHDLTIKAAKEKKSKNGNLMLVVDLVAAEEGFTRDNLLLEGPGAFKMEQFLSAVGVSKEEAEGMEASDFVGMTVTADIVIEPYEGKDYSKVKKYIAG